MKSDPANHHITGDILLPCEVRNVRPVRRTLPIAQIYIKDPKPIVTEKPPAKRWHISFGGSSKPVIEDKFTERLSRLN